MFAGLAASLGTGVMNNMVSQRNAETSYNRQKAMMQEQERYNAGMMVSAPRAQVEGLRMAGFNPAMIEGSMSPASVSQGNADMPQTMPVSVDPQAMLLEAQAEKLQADTELVKAQTKTEEQKPENVRQSTEYVIAQRLNKDADTDKLEQEAIQLRNINDTFANENDLLAQTGMIMAEKWKKQKWYEALGPDTKATIDAIASGEIPMSVGAMNALMKTIKAQGDLSDADAKIVKNAFSNAVIDSQFSDKNVMDALKRDPKAKVELTEAQAKKLRYRMKDIIDEEIDKIHSETNVNNSEYWMNLKKKLAFEYENMDLSRAEGRYGNYAWRTMENLLDHALRIIEMILVGKGLKGMNSGPQIPDVLMTKTTKYPDSHDTPIYDASGNRVHGTGATKGYTKTERVNTQGRGVQDFKF